MLLILGSDQNGMGLKEVLKKELLEGAFEVLDATEHQACDFADAAVMVACRVMENPDSFGIIVDAWGSGPFMCAAKIKGVIACPVYDERTAYMTRAHNNTQIITLGAAVTGEELAKKIVHSFISGTYDGGRHQIRVDMLKKMGRNKLSAKEETV